MNIETLHKITQFRGLTQSDIARAANVSRQAVSQWFGHTGFLPILSNHLWALSKTLGTSADVLLNEIADREWWENETTNLLWDGLFADLVSFLAALNNGDLRALARLVEIYGLFAAAKIVGPQAWALFEDFKRFLPPVRRRELEQLWNTQKELGMFLNEKNEGYPIKDVLDKLKG